MILARVVRFPSLNRHSCACRSSFIACTVYLWMSTLSLSTWAIIFQTPFQPTLFHNLLEYLQLAKISRFWIARPFNYPTRKDGTLVRIPNSNTFISTVNDLFDNESQGSFRILFRWYQGPCISVTFRVPNIEPSANEHMPEALTIRLVFFRELVSHILITKNNF